ncbi:MAG: site-specific integrase [Syntrophobacterales bacterium]|jgi:integrase
MLEAVRLRLYLGGEKTSRGVFKAVEVSANPFARRGMYKEYPKGQHIPDEEFRKVYGFLPDSLKCVVLTAYLTGMRQGEILNLRWERVNLFQGFIDLTPADTKTKEPRYIFFSSLPELKKVFVEAARKRVSGHEIVFSQQDGSPISKWYLKRQFRKACETAKVGPYRFHDLRHTFNTNMVKAGVPEPVVMKLTGHKTLAMFLRYSHLDREQAEAAMTKLDGLLSEKKKQETDSVQGSPKKEEREG